MKKSTWSTFIFTTLKSAICTSLQNTWIILILHCSLPISVSLPPHHLDAWCASFSFYMSSKLAGKSASSVKPWASCLFQVSLQLKVKAQDFLIESNMLHDRRQSPSASPHKCNMEIKTIASICHYTCTASCLHWMRSQKYLGQLYMCRTSMWVSFTPSINNRTECMIIKSVLTDSYAWSLLLKQKKPFS